jgi:tetratricopeptide (TPR) repeat protein
MHVLRDPESAKRALFFLRDPAWIQALDADARAEYEEHTDEARAKLANLKVRIRASGARVEEYETPDDIGPLVAAALSAQVEALFPDIDAPDSFTQTQMLHRAYARQRRGLHIGAAPYLAALDQWVARIDAPPLLITGASGGGKSTLVANWLEVHRSGHLNDIVFEHYLGASPESADPRALMHRMWEHLNRATGEFVDLPKRNVDLIDFTDGLAQRLTQANRFAERAGANIIIALDGLDKLSSEPNLRWLPRELPARVKWLASSLEGEARQAAEARGWVLLEVWPSSEAERRELVVRTLEGWGKELSEERIARLLAHPSSGTPLFLKTVLDELRVSATHAQVQHRLDHYLRSRDMADLFARVLQRLDEDCEPELAAKALPMIWASRAGLEETEIIAIADATPLAWATLRNGLGDALRDQEGRVVFSHDFLRQAVETRYLASDEKKRGAHLALADQFDTHDADVRQAEELPFQLRAAEAWDRLEALLVDLDRFALLRARGDSELLSYWLPLKARGRDPEVLLCGAFEVYAGVTERWSQAEIGFAFALGGFLRFAGATGYAYQNLDERLAAACERLFGADHPDTLTSMDNLAETLRDRGDLEGAQRYLERVLKTRALILGSEHPDTLSSMGKLAETLSARGDLQGAQKYEERVLEASARSLGREHPLTLTSMNNLAQTLYARGDLVGAQHLYERMLDARTRVLGPEHPDTLIGMNNLAATLRARGDFEGAQKYGERAVEATTRILGPEHPDTLMGMDNLAETLRARGDLEGAQKYGERALEARTRIVGPEHPYALLSMDNLAGTLRARGDLEGAQALQGRVLEASTRILGPEHPSTLTRMNNLAQTLYARGDLEGALVRHEHALEASTRILGPEHPSTLTSMNNLAQTLYVRGDLEGTQALQERVLEARTRILGPEHPATLASMHNYAATLYARGNFARALPLSERALEGRVRLLGPEHLDALDSKSLRNAIRSASAETPRN